MKKHLLILAAAFLLLFSLSLPAAAQETDYFVFDVDGNLDPGAVTSLNEKSAELSAQYGCGIYAAVFDNMSDFGYYDIEAFTEAVYHESALGYTEDGDGILLVLSIEERDYDLAAYGSFANYAFTDYGKGVIAEAFLDEFRNDDWAGGISDYIEVCGKLLDDAVNGEPLDVSYGNDYGYDNGYVNSRSQDSLSRRLKSSLPAGLFVGVIVGQAYCGILKRKMKSARTATEADRYVSDHGVDLRYVVDQFSHVTVVHQHIDRDSGSRSGGGGTHVNSGGFSHHSGKF